MDSPQKRSSCLSYYLSLKQQDSFTVQYKIIPVKCKSWDCPECAKYKAFIYRKRISALFDGRQLFMYTFTYYHDSSVESVWNSYNVAWNRFRTAAHKKYGSFAYVRILESHEKSNYPHLHVIADKRFEDTWIAAELKSAGFGYQAKCAPVTSEGASYYISKYLTKPWTNEVSKTIRKTLHLRLISFGGFPNVKKPARAKYECICRSNDKAICRDAVDIEVEWDLGQSWQKTYEKDEPDYYEATFVILDPHTEAPFEAVEQFLEIVVQEELTL